MRPSEGPGSIDVPVRVFSYDLGAGGKEFTRAIAVEAPVQIVLGGAPFAVMMATPQDLEDFAAGFVLTEQIAESVADIRGIEVEARRGRLEAQDRAHRRAIAGPYGARPGDERAHRLRPLRHRGFFPDAVAPAAARSAGSDRARRDPRRDSANSRPGSPSIARPAPSTPRHGAGGTGKFCLSREDVGRHNALDKAIGALARARVAPDSGFFVITSRCSFEMVAKAAIFGAGTLVSVSAPTSLALERARRFGVRLIAVARADQALSFDGGKDEASGGLAA